jgi:cytosine/adenosine deaminase-related metal-dependent hydrolase
MIKKIPIVLLFVVVAFIQSFLTERTVGEAFQTPIILRGKIVTMNNGEIIEDGKIFIDNQKIESVVPADSNFPAGIDPNVAVYIDTGGTVYPGLINAHDHIGYNAVPMWNVTQEYSNRYQWQQTQAYDENVRWYKGLLTGYWYGGYRWFNNPIEVDKFAEVKQLLAGTTSVQGGAFNNTAVTQTLLRNIEHDTYVTAADKVRTNVGNVIYLSSEDVNNIIDDMDSGSCEAWFVHLSEGVDESSQDEFDWLKANNLLRDETIIIHGTALTPQDFQDMSAAGAKLVWSPTSNLLLYGHTTDVISAKNNGVLISISTDWTPSGTKHLLDEVKVVDQLNMGSLGNIFTDRDLAEMITINPAKAAGWDNHLGTIEEGKYADIVVLSGMRENPYRQLIEATTMELSLVLIGGEPLAGDLEYMELLKSGDFETVYAENGQYTKAVDVTKPDVYLGYRTLEFIMNHLSNIMETNYEYMHENAIDDALRSMTLEEFISTFMSTFPNIAESHLDGLVSHDDLYYISLLTKNLGFDIFEIYYGIAGCVVDVDDLGKFCDIWLESGPQLEADFDDSNDVDFKDFSYLGDLWLKPCPMGWPLE